MISLLDERIQWLRDRGSDQWSTGRTFRTRLRNSINRKETWLLLDGGAAIGTVSINTDGDPDFWTPEELAEPAIYVGKMATRTARSGEGLGALMMPEHQIVVITAPLTDKTRGMVDKRFLAAMPDGALLVNAGRGKIVDTDALVSELQSQRLRAALDVTDPEPPPKGHPLWTCAGVIISPHMARTVPGANSLCYAVAAERIGAMLTGASRA